MSHCDVIYHLKAFFLISAMQNIPSELIITVKNYSNITSFKMKGSPDLGQAELYKQIKAAIDHQNHQNGF